MSEKFATYDLQDSVQCPIYATILLALSCVAGHMFDQGIVNGWNDALIAAFGFGGLFLAGNAGMVGMGGVLLAMRALFYRTTRRQSLLSIASNLSVLLIVYFVLDF